MIPSFNWKAWRLVVSIFDVYFREVVENSSGINCRARALLCACVYLNKFSECLDIDGEARTLIRSDAIESLLHLLTSVANRNTLEFYLCA